MIFNASVFPDDKSIGFTRHRASGVELVARSAGGGAAVASQPPRPVDRPVSARAEPSGVRRATGRGGNAEPLCALSRLTNSRRRAENLWSGSVGKVRSKWQTGDNVTRRL